MNYFECQSCGAYIDEKSKGIATICPYCNSRNIKRSESEKDLLNLECPFCGGAFSLPDSYNMSKCPYCSRSIFIQMAKDILQFFYEPARSIDECSDIALQRGFSERKRTVYLPFWALRGTLISWILGYRKIEAPKAPQLAGSYASSYQSGIPAAAGAFHVSEQKAFRDFSSRLLFISIGDYVARMIKQYNLGTRIYIEKLSVKNYEKLAESADLLKPLFSTEEAMDKLMDIAYKPPAVGKESVVVQSVRLDMVGKKFLLIYAPFFRFSKAGQSLLIDAFSKEPYIVSDRVLFDPAPKKIDDSLYGYRVVSASGDRHPTIGALDLVPFLCPVCGADLPEKRLDCFIQCKNCKANLVIENDRLKKIDAFYVDIPESFMSNPDRCRIKYYPYWRFKAVFYSSGRKIDQISRLRFLFTGFIDRYQRDKEFLNIFMYIPAFGRINSPGLDKISSIYTKMQIVYGYSGEFDETNEKAAVIYDHDDAENFAYTILLKTSNLNKSSSINRIRNNFIRLKDPKLFYFPFLVNPVGMHMDPILGLNYMKNSFVSERSY